MEKSKIITILVSVFVGILMAIIGVLIWYIVSLTSIVNQANANSVYAKQQTDNIMAFLAQKFPEAVTQQ